MGLPLLPLPAESEFKAFELFLYESINLFHFLNLIREIYDNRHFPLKQRPVMPVEVCFLLNFFSQGETEKSLSQKKCFSSKKKITFCSKELGRRTFFRTII